MFIVAFIGCKGTSQQKISTQEMSGVYKNQDSSEKIVLNSDGTYSLWNGEAMFFDLAIEQCEYASRGKWSFMDNNVISITSEDNYIKQKGFEYQIKKENKFSQDSLYINVIFPSDFHPVKLRFSFNYDVSRSIITDKTYIVLSKSKHLRNESISNGIGFSLDANVAGTEFYSSRTMFNIFEENEEEINTKQFNYLTIFLPCFDRCFFEFIPYRQSFIYIRNKNELLWRGDSWKK
jgi:hypothetical protein